jgi:hypothetical protein|tara:strand:+ start:402 stop:638 length:237 start_codon:yes stop_codon:yes gene_type:complete
MDLTDLFVLLLNEIVHVELLNVHIDGLRNILVRVELVLVLSVLLFLSVGVSGLLHVHVLQEKGAFLVLHSVEEAVVSL